MPSIKEDEKEIKTKIIYEEYPLGCGEFDGKNPNLSRCCGDVLFSNKIWLCEKCMKKNYTKSQKAIIENGDAISRKSKN